MLPVAVSLAVADMYVSGSQTSSVTAGTIDKNVLRSLNNDLMFALQAQQAKAGSGRRLQVGFGF